jgi:hypothetical protein
MRLILSNLDWGSEQVSPVSDSTSMVMGNHRQSKTSARKPAVKARKIVPSRRVAWPEPGRDEGGEFRLTWGRLAAIITTFVALAGAVPLYWTISDHWMNRQEIEKKIKDHADHDNGVQAWNAYNFAANRVEYLDDKVAECGNAEMVQKKVSPDIAANCARYRAKLQGKQQEANDLRSKAQETTKEK